MSSGAKTTSGILLIVGPALCPNPSSSWLRPLPQAGFPSAFAFHRDSIGLESHLLLLLIHMEQKEDPEGFRLDSFQFLADEDIKLSRQFLNLSISICIFVSAFISCVDLKRIHFECFKRAPASHIKDRSCDVADYLIVTSKFTMVLPLRSCTATQ